MPFKKGDVVEVVVGKEHYAVAKETHYVVADYNAERWSHRDGAVYLEGVTHWLCADRFKLVKPEELVFAVGAQVERTGESTNLLEQGHQYTIQTIYRDELGGVNKIKLQGINASYHVRGFKVVQNAPKAVFDVKKWVPQEGDTVVIVAKDRYWAGGMDFLLNNGEEYTIRSVRERTDGGKHYYVSLNNGYVFDAHASLRPVAVVNKVAAQKPPKPEPKELREALFQHLGQRLGNDLCAFSFETKDGRQYHYPYVCHARLNNDHGEIVKMAYCLRHDIKRVRAPNTVEAHKAYAEYIISGSPWKDAFITQDIEEAISKDILMNVEVNRYMMAGACVALRTGQEYPDRPGIFKEMLDRGHNPHTCWLMSCAFSRVKEGQYNFNSWTGGHDVIDKYCDFEQVIQFFQTGYHIEKCPGTYGGVCHPLTTEPFRTHHGAYAIANTIAKSSDRDMPKSIGAWFEANTVKSTVGEGWDKKTVMDVKALDDVATKLDKLIKGEA